MRKFNFRAPRLSIDLSVRVTQGEATRLGHCTEISVEGMKLEGPENSAAGSLGTVQISHEDLSLQLPFRTVYSQINCSGVVFIYESNEQRQKINYLVSLLSAPRPCTSLALRR